MPADRDIPYHASKLKQQGNNLQGKCKLAYDFQLHKFCFEGMVILAEESRHRDFCIFLGCTPCLIHSRRREGIPFYPERM
jgi:hypothetical protein